MQQTLKKALLPIVAAGALCAAVPAMAADYYPAPRPPRAAVVMPVVPTGPLTVEQAIQVAYGVGVVNVKNTHLDGDEWTVEGRDSYGKWIEVDVDARTGQINNVDRSII